MKVIDTNDNVTTHLPFLKSKGVEAIGRYYSSSAWKRITKAEAAAISSAGIRIFVVFEDSGDPTLSVDRGIHDAQIALGQARGIGQPAGSAIYFAMEHLPHGYTHAHVAGIQLYFEGVRQVLAETYKIGVYSDGVVLEALLDTGLCEFAWLSASTSFEGSKDFDKSGRWALAQRKVDQDWNGLSVDTNDAKPDFGAFLVAQAQPAADGGAGPAATALAMAGPAASAGPVVAANSWTFRVQRLREEKRPGEGFKRTVGTYQVYHNGVAVEGLSGMTVERQGPGDNTMVGKREHRCIAAGSYPLNGHRTVNFRTVGYKTSGAHPRPAIEVGDTDKREGILIHPADGYASTIGCINLSGPLTDADSDIEFSDSFRRVVDVIDDLTRFHGGVIPAGDAEPIANSSLIVEEPGEAHVAHDIGMMAAALAAAPAIAAMGAAAAVGGIIDCDVVIQAGHENTPDGATGGQGPLGNEIDWTPIVANEAVRLLRAAGVNAIKETAHIKVTHQTYRCKLALFIHFDDPGSALESGPSVGYSHPSDSPAAQRWKELYKEFFPFNDTWRNDNFTEDEHFYYGFKFTVTSDAEFLIELGDLHSLRQAQWLKPRLTWLGNLIAHYVSDRIDQGGIPKPAPIAAPPQHLEVALAAGQPSGAAEPFTTKPSISGNAGGSSKTKGLNGTKQRFDDATIVIEATEALSATRADGLNATLTAFQRRVEKDGITNIEQRNYCYRTRQLPNAALFGHVNDFPAELPEGFTATAVRSVVGSQFGKNDTEDEGTGSPVMGIIQTNSEVFGASIKASAMARVFGPGWTTSEKRLRALAEIFFPAKNRLVRVPLVDIGPGEKIRAEVDLTWACDQFLGTQGQADVRYRVLVPT